MYAQSQFWKQACPEITGGKLCWTTTGYGGELITGFYDLVVRDEDGMNSVACNNTFPASHIRSGEQFPSFSALHRFALVRV